MKQRNNETYAKGKDGGERYPRRSSHLFIKDSSGEFRYARDKDGNEYYPIVKNKSVVMLNPVTLDFQLAYDAHGNEVYPKDGHGNEYYLTFEGKPFLLHRANGSPYYAKTHKGSTLIPWNHIPVSETPLLFGKDAAGNLVYMTESDLPKSVKTLIQCLCHIAVICPKEFNCKLPTCIT